MAGQQEKLLEQIARSLERLERQGAKAGGGRALQAPSGDGLFARAQKSALDLSAGRAFGGGIAGGLAGGAVGVAGSAIGAGVSAAAQAGGAGLVSAFQGGTFGGGVARSLQQQLAGVPVLGELAGAAPAERVLAGTQGDLNALTNQVARFAGAGAITPQVRRMIAGQLRGQQENLERDRQANAAETAAQLPNVAGDIGGGSTAILGKLQEILDAMVRGSFGGGGAGART